MTEAKRIRALLLDIERDLSHRETRGNVADYIPQLAQVSPRRFGISVCLADGAQISVGDATVPFSIQSISKVMTLAIALGRFGDDIWKWVGREPSTHVFNSGQELEARQGHPPNPFVNAGAIVTTDALLVNGTPKETLAELLQFVRQAASDDAIHIKAAVAKSENETGHQNWALAHMLRARRNLRNSCDLVLGTYFHHCAIEMTCEQLARFGRCVSRIGKGGVLLPQDHAQNLLALMMTCGHYQGSGEFAFQVGIPAKSGVGGGILACVPGRASVAVWSPGLNQQGNSLLGTEALRALSSALGWSTFNTTCHQTLKTAQG